MATITKDDVLKLARLSMISLSEEEVLKFQAELDEILSYIQKLADADVEGLSPTNQVTGLVNVMREDEIADSVTQDELLKNLPDREDNYIKVKRVL